MRNFNQNYFSKSLDCQHYSNFIKNYDLKFKDEMFYTTLTRKLQQ